MTVPTSLRTAGTALLLGGWLALAAGSAVAQSTAPATATAAPAAKPAAAVTLAAGPTTTVAPAGATTAPMAEPQPGETHAERARSQPGNNAPVWRAARDSGVQPGYASLPGAEQGVLIQPFVQYPGSRFTTAGEAWRQVRNNWILPYGGALLLLVATAIGLFYWRRGPMGGHIPDTGRKVERFTPFERAAHGLNAIAFVLLAVSGLVMAFGKWVLLPLTGSTLFGWLAYALKNIHNFAGPVFVITLLVVIVTFVKDNIPKAHDWSWIRHAGGLLSDHEVPSHRFNAGEKGMFWLGVCALGLLVSVSGLVLDHLVPGMTWLRGDMQIAHMVHAVTAIGMMVILGGHIYMGTIGMKGAYETMRTGWVDESWAKEHHQLWYDDIQAGRIPAQRSRAAGPQGPSGQPAAATR